MAWERITSRRGQRMGDLSKVNMSIESKGAGQQEACLTARIFIGADIAKQLGFVATQRVTVDRDPEARLLRVAPSPGGLHRDETYALMGSSHRAAGKKSGTISMRLSLLALGVKQQRVRVLPESCVWRIEDGALIFTPPAWAWDDYVLPPDQPDVPKHAKKLPMAAPVQPTSPPPAPSPVDAADDPLVRLPLRVQLVPEYIPPERGDQLELEQMLRSGRGAREVSEYFGLPLTWCQEYARTFREAQAALASAKGAA